MSDTKESLQRADKFETEWQHHRDDALKTCINEATEIIQEIEHHVDDIDLTVEIRDVPKVAEAIKKVSNLRYFEFSAEVEGKYDVYEESFDYDFTKEVKEFLQDSLGYDFTLILGEKL